MDYPTKILRSVFRRRFRRQHLLAFIRYNSVRKFANLLHNQIEKKAGRVTLSSKPFLINAEPTNHCNFRCLFCPTGKRSGRPAGLADPAAFEKVFSEIGKYVYLITLHGWGEPLLHDGLPEIIRSAHKHRIYTVVSTNGSKLNPALSEALIRSRLDYLIFSIDGNSPETFSKYRKGGNFEQIIGGLKELIHLKKKLKSRTPLIEWQFVVFKHNEHEMTQARQCACELGVDSFIPMPAYTEDPAFDASDPRYHLPKGPPIYNLNECNHLWSTLTFHWNGQVVPCCYDYPEAVSYGNLHSESVDAIWNNSLFKASRSLVTGKPVLSDAPLYCYRCAGLDRSDQPDEQMSELFHRSPNKPLVEINP